MLPRYVSDCSYHYTGYRISLDFRLAVAPTSKYQHDGYRGPVSLRANPNRTRHCNLVLMAHWLLVCAPAYLNLRTSESG